MPSAVLQSHGKHTDDRVRAASPLDPAMAQILDQLGQHPDGDPTCQLCNGWGWAVPDRMSAASRFAGLRECRCVEERIAVRQRLEAFQQRIRYSHFEEQHAAKTFAAFNMYSRADESLREAFSVARNYAFAEPVDGWLVFFGPYGCGKTHLALAIANELLARSIPVFYAVMPDLLEQLREGYDDRGGVSYQALMDQVRSIDVLILDDLGAEYKTPWADEKLYRIIAKREDRALPTIITTNRPLDALEPRVASRLYTHLYQGKILTINAPDYRTRQAEARLPLSRTARRSPDSTLFTTNQVVGMLKEVPPWSHSRKS